MYDHINPSLRGAVLNAYGLANRRRMDRWTAAQSFIAPSETWAIEQQRAYVAARLRDILAEAATNVSRYNHLRPVARDLLGGWDDVIAVLRCFPVVSRAELAADPWSFMSVAFRRRHLSPTRTSGTTGTSLTTWLEPSAVTATDSLAWRRNLWAGWIPGDWIARLVGDPVIPLSVAAPARAAHVSYSDRRIYFSAFHMSSDYALRVAEILIKRRPEFLMGYPSTLAALFTGAREVFEGSDWRPKAILYSSEPLFDHQRTAIHAAICAPIRGYYGCAERVVSATECEHGSYHLNLLDGYVEGTLDNVEEGPGTLVTGLLNRAMPLIRYQIGDRIVMRRRCACACGRSLPVIEDVVTKLDDVVVTPSGRQVSPSLLTWAFKDLSGLERSQIVQVDGSAVQVRVVCDDQRFLHISQALRQRLAAMLFGEMRIDVLRVETLDVTRAGKTRFVVQMHSGNALKDARPKQD